MDTSLPILRTACIAAVCVTLSFRCEAQEAAERPQFAIGDHWEFTFSGNKAGRWMREIAEILDDGRMRVMVRPGSLALYDQDMNFVNFAGNRERESTNVLAKYPLRVGSEWQFPLTTESFAESHSGSAKVVAFEKLTVPAGTFDCFVVEAEIQYRQKLYSHRRLFKRWYCPEIKWIAKEIQDTIINDPYNGGSRIETQTSLLVSFVAGH